MPKRRNKDDDRFMRTAVTIHGHGENSGKTRTYFPGEEDELEEAMSPAQLARLVQTGALEGSTWDARGKDLPWIPAKAKRLELVPTEG